MFRLAPLRMAICIDSRSLRHGRPVSCAPMEHLRNPRTDRYALLLLLILLTIVSISISQTDPWGHVWTSLLISATVLVALRTSNARKVTIRVAAGIVIIGVGSSLINAIEGDGHG